MSEVFFLPVDVKRIDIKRSLLMRYEKLLNKLITKDMVDGKLVAIKFHLADAYSFTHVHPVFVIRVVERVKECGGTPFVTDHRRDNRRAGMIPEAFGCPIYHATALKDRYAYTVKTRSKLLPEVHVAGYLKDADVLINLSHAKGHGMCGFGGAIKNLAMGAVTGKTRGAIHHLLDKDFTWHADKCIHCNKCVEHCEHDAISFNDKDKLQLDTHFCTFCLHCMLVCPTGAITVGTRGWPNFQKGLALATKAVLDTFDKKRTLHINVATGITPICDCWGFSFVPIRPDVGIFVSTDPIAVDKASIDAIDCDDVIPGSLPNRMSVKEGDENILFRIWGKDPYEQIRAGEKLRIGSSKYTVKKIV